MTNDNFKDKDCKYRTFLADYNVSNKGTKDEQVFIDYNKKSRYLKDYTNWLHLMDLKDKREWKPCRPLTN